MSGASSPAPARAQPRGRRRRAAIAGSLLLLLFAGVAVGGVPVEHFRLDNGMTFLVVERPARVLVAAVWAVRSGSGDETPGATGVSHLLEHLLFSGSEAIGTRDWELESELIVRRDRLMAELSEATSPRSRRRLERRLEAVDRELETVRVEGELAYHYAQAGAVGLDARTTKDLSLYSVMIPASRLELWHWLESDRLLRPVFRGLHKEYAVVEEERRGRLEASPVGPLLEDFDRRFWGRGHPYSWSVDGLPGDLQRLDRQTLRRYYRQAYVPSNLVAAIVGDVDVERIRELAQRYFGRLEANEGTDLERPGTEAASAPDSGRGTVEVTRQCVCRAQVELRYPTVQFAHRDALLLDLAVGLLNGRDGRLHQRVVLGRDDAFSASAQHTPLRRGGTFSIFAQARDDSASLDELIAVLDAEIARLASGEIDPKELARVARQLATEAARQAKEPLELAKRLALYEALGSWEVINTRPARAMSARPEDVAEAVRRYLQPQRHSALRLRAQPPTPTGNAP